jgi:hypothetical protein
MTLVGVEGTSFDPPGDGAALKTLCFQRSFIQYAASTREPEFQIRPYLSDIRNIRIT